MVKVVPNSFEIMTPLDGEAILKHLELCIRNCYKSEDKIEPGSAEKMVRKIVELKHEAMIEHFSVTVKMTTDLGVYKDLTRHRIASWAIESTRYCNYSRGKFGSEITVMEPPYLTKGTEDYNIWLNAMQEIENAYNTLAGKGYKADLCRMLLPHSIKADVILTANLREWRHIFKLRTAKAAHPCVQDIMKKVLKEFKARIPILFDDINPDEE
ncbi:MAG: FAD-dependent thymidylate synthase [Lactobacillales bacterium]|jgi:thymidylate synthase (FAD)|nr:FAD-dependent thymidylate synthase [Lactobacillales bacterium]